MQHDDTIFALSSGHGRAGVAVVRVSGEQTRDILESLAQRESFSPRRAVLVDLVHPVTATLIDRALALFFPGPKSFTGEDVAEFHVHGSRAVLDELFGCLSAMAGVRPAEAGEFTRRAFYNGKMDLTEVEGLSDLLAAETRAQKNQALAQAGGALGQLYGTWRQALVKASALVEADIDFADEDLPDDLWQQASPFISRVAAEIAAHLADGHRGERLRDGYRVAILGAPNVGKSSLINLLARRDVAIVSDEPGTTRDVVEVHLDLGGFAVIVMDTAGLRDGVASVEAEGIRRARKSAEEADLRVWMADYGTWPEPGAACDGRRDGDLLIWNKMDRDELPVETRAQTGEYFISAKRETGIGAVIEALTDKVSGTDKASGELEGSESVSREMADTPLKQTPSLTRARHRMELEATLAPLVLLKDRSEAGNLDSDLLAEDLRQAIRSLGRLTGRVDVEEILDHIFGDFCIGK